MEGGGCLGLQNLALIQRRFPGEGCIDRAQGHSRRRRSGKHTHTHNAMGCEGGKGQNVCVESRAKGEGREAEGGEKRGGRII